MNAKNRAAEVATYTWANGKIIARPVLDNGTPVPFYPQDGESWIGYEVVDGFLETIFYTQDARDANALGNALALAAEAYLKPASDDSSSEGYCEHGTYVGGVMEDFMCGYCEA